jgi:hypothetical protein
VADYDGASVELATLEAVSVALPDLAERWRLLDGPLRTLAGAAREIETAAERNADPLLPCRSREGARCHDSVRRFHAIATDTNTQELADRLSELTEQAAPMSRN